MPEYLSRTKVSTMHGLVLLYVIVLVLAPLEYCNRPLVHKLMTSACAFVASVAGLFPTTTTKFAVLTYLRCWLLTS